MDKIHKQKWLSCVVAWSQYNNKNEYKLSMSISNQSILGSVYSLESTLHIQMFLFLFYFLLRKMLNTSVFNPYLV